MLPRICKVFAVALPLMVMSGVAGPKTAEAECAPSIVCQSADRWVCCSPSADECSNFMIDYCNSVAGSDPFDQECGWV